MVPQAKIAQVVKDLHQRVAQLKREKREQIEAFAKQDALTPTNSDGLWSRCAAWLSTARV
jgi:hypothetical protein